MLFFPRFYLLLAQPLELDVKFRWCGNDPAVVNTSPAFRVWGSMEYAEAYVRGTHLDDYDREAEKDILLRWRDGDRKAFGILVGRYMEDAYLTALGLTGNAEDARDLSQDAFVKAFQARSSFDPSRPFYPWFYRILKNHCLNYVQRIRRRTESLYADSEETRERFATEGPTTLEKLVKEERVRIIHAAINRLTFEHREIIVLKNFKGLSYREIAEVLDVPIGTVMSRLYYARRALRQIITEWESTGMPEDAYAGSRPAGRHGEVV